MRERERERESERVGERLERNRAEGVCVVGMCVCVCVSWSVGRVCACGDVC